jgi:hypothetical protein
LVGLDARHFNVGSDCDLEFVFPQGKPPGAYVNSAVPQLEETNNATHRRHAVEGPERRLTAFDDVPKDLDGLVLLAKADGAGTRGRDWRQEKKSTCDHCCPALRIHAGTQRARGRFIQKLKRDLEPGGNALLLRRAPPNGH